MSGVQQITVAAQEGELRLDRWFKRHYPRLTHGRLEKLLRTGQVRVDGGRVKANHRLEPGQTIRVPPLGDDAEKKPPKRTLFVSDREVLELQAMVLFMDDDLIAINKPSGLAVQGGTKTDHHLDGMLDALRFDAEERPRLVHRLDRDTSGVLVLARTARSAAALGKLFQSRDMEKLYWALVIGQPKHPAGTISAALAKTGDPGRQKMVWDEEGKKAVTDYRTVEEAGGKVTWLELSPQTGRTHQLRAHCALLNTPILGDHKYAGHSRTTPDSGLLAEIGNRLCLHARRLVIPKARPTHECAAAPRGLRPGRHADR